MFLAAVFGASRQVRVVAEGRFFCLYCGADRSYQLREWRQTSHLFFIPVGTSGGVFVLCPTCKTGFDPECLDESSTAELHELEVDVPGFACTVVRRQAASALSEYLGQAPAPAPAPAPGPAASAEATKRAGSGSGKRQSLSARSRNRKH